MNKVLLTVAVVALVMLAGCTQSGVQSDAGTTDDGARHQATPESMEATAQNTPSAGTTDSAAYIGEAEVKKIALEHAGLSEADVVFIRVHLDYDDWRNEYEVEFYSGDVEYDYDIDAETGEIRSFDRDAEYYAPSPSAGGQAAGGSTGGSAASGDIGEARAKEIALEHAGYTASEVQWLKVERDHDHGRLEYEVEFYIGRTEYSYEIDAASGTVLNYEAEQDD
jgi:uncharacterized membrane protein YkoI